MLAVDAQMMTVDARVREKSLPAHSQTELSVFIVFQKLL